MSFIDLKESIIDSRLCTHCGACSVVCPKEFILHDDLTVKSITDPSLLDCGDCTNCLDVCPGEKSNTDVIEQKIFGRSRKEEERWLGIYQNVFGARSTIPEVFEKSASGGTVTTLLIAAKEHLNVDTYLVMGRNEEQPWRSEPQLIDDPYELVHFSQSTYQLATYLHKLREVFKQSPEKNIAIAGLACHMQAIRKMQLLQDEFGAWARERIKLLIEIGCSSNTLPKGTEGIIQELLNLKLEEVISVKYREGVYPGNIVVTTKDGNSHEVSFWRAVKYFKSNKTFRCLSCADWISGLADLSVSDGDPNIFDASLGLNSIQKHGRLFVRTDSGRALMQASQQSGILEYWAIELVGENLGLNRKIHRRAHYEKLDVKIPKPPIVGHIESINPIDDEVFLTVKTKEE